ncbi:MAG: SMC-Scp complex subunit ScpB [Bacillota bacterium]|uniref:Segregation and condensation protein B n=1 Tax=Virgibacillus salarius TaxID=447199 RepID=A0A941DVY8_9BACI|nr:SMC-Scp complex subunit ScpB [Virgibacillus sp. AGTR]MBR7797710.1 SMC-Scp complex subunit ScpB [Virgibacillus salarius]MCC2249123.1 SMC-Scp complex subunit ScpB [Virgibacillus sp. AGTR]NAZ10420.1 SMC-Scp complex subunit ScpB [Agaribacter marinus]QRZ16969.1 SMC-Scp complex subunit ScpB [Virgibacillus sp. AGTR]
MEITKLKAIVEGLLFASGNEGITIKQLSKVLEITEATVEHLIEELKYDYDNTDRGIMIMQAHEVYHLTTKPEHSPYYKKLLETPQTTRMSQAALETLAIIAYQQPITRTEIEEIRGVKSDRPVQTLLSRLLIEEVGRKDSVGKPILFATSKEFLTYFGLTSLEELPPLPENTGSDELESEADLFFERFSENLSNRNTD